MIRVLSLLLLLPLLFKGINEEGCPCLMPP